MTEPAEILLIDLSSIAYPIYMTSSKEPDPDYVSTKVVERVRALASGKRWAAICCDKGKSFRSEISSEYKANRPEHEARLHYQIDLAREILVKDGFPVWAVPGFEADDLIATATKMALALDPEMQVLIASADKDLLQLVNGRVKVLSPKSGTIFDSDGVKAKFGVLPEQMRDYLCIVGDTSDNVKGARNIGEKRASTLLTLFGSLENLYRELNAKGAKQIGVPEAQALSLSEFAARWDEVKSLITLRDDVEIPFEQLCQDRVPVDAEPLDGDDLLDGMEEEPMGEPTETIPTAVAEAHGKALEAAQDAPGPTNVAPPFPQVIPGPIVAPAASQALVKHEEPDVLAPAPVEWERQLEPRSMREVEKLATYAFKAALFSAYSNPHAVLTTLMTGRELGMPAMASLRAIHIIEGKPALAADLIRALVIRSGKAKYFRCIERTAEKCTYKTLRIGEDEEPISLTFTIQEARLAWTKTQDAFDKSGYGKNPADLLVARASSKLARLVYPDVVHGLYSPEELG